MKIKYSFALIILPMLLTACNDDANDQNAAASASPSQSQANVTTPDQQFVISQETPAAVMARGKFGVCSLDTILSASGKSSTPGELPNSFRVERRKAYKLIGFATNKDEGRVLKTIKLLLVGQKVYEHNVTTGIERQDVVKFFKIPEFTNAGYEFDAAFDDVPPGDYQVFVVEVEGDQSLASPTHKVITVR